MSDAATGQRRDGGSRKVGVGFTVAAGVMVFAILVWVAFSLGFQRMQADLSLDHKTSLDQPPIFTFEADAQGWTLVRPGNDELGTGPEYGNISDSIDALCVFSWTTGNVSDPEILDAETDEAATLKLLEEQGHDTANYGTVRLVNESGRSIELVYLDADTATGLDGVIAARTFVGTGENVIFSMKCEQTGELDQEIMQDTLLGVEANLSVSP
ncbi:hypothetical protein [Gulosibacter molinativorax]|uniref:DUF4245 domain-containing protein n=1 Tax=Gulosibacter molinativorax TaxID=256821 RepID=A0ABT7CAR2_9MICO|nr:hypothetical protein [Gulosibacter molinativorax]MDJ1371731.1 hypothetical protein [Gulosibacter molinativorax]QUY63153.1 Hypotetical protein [Gulosibacter molinativorax]